MDRVQRIMRSAALVLGLILVAASVCFASMALDLCDLRSEMGIYRDNLSTIVIGDNLLPIIVITQNSFDLSITDIAFSIHFVITDKLSR